MTIVYLIILSCICGCLYRMGGCGPADLIKEWGWVPAPIRNFPKKRDVGCGVVTLAAGYAVGIGAPWWMWLISFGAMWGALSTYHDYINGKDNFYLHGLVIGLALALPFFYWTPGWGLWIRAGILGVGMGVWSAINGNATWEEFGRGFLMPITLIGVV